MSDCLEATNWAVMEFADADLGDLRRTQRLVQLAHVLAHHPGAALPEACGSGAMLKAAYRFFANEDIEPADIVQSHIEATYSRLNAVPLVLAVQDTTEADWTSLRATEGLGPLGHTACQGLLVHTTLAITPERVPLGLLAQQVWARDPDDRGVIFQRCVQSSQVPFNGFLSFHTSAANIRAQRHCHCCEFRKRFMHAAAPVLVERGISVRKPTIVQRHGVRRGTRGRGVIYGSALWKCAT